MPQRNFCGQPPRGLPACPLSRIAFERNSEFSEASYAFIFIVYNAQSAGVNVYV